MPCPSAAAVRFPDDGPSQYFYWDEPARRMTPETLDCETALEGKGGGEGFSRLRMNAPPAGISLIARNGAVVTPALRRSRPIRDLTPLWLASSATG